MYLAIDIGGTKVTVAHYDGTAGGLRRLGKERYASRDYGGLEAILQDYKARFPLRYAAIGVGVAGPVVGRSAAVTNLPWRVDADALAAEFGVPVALVNDLEAHGYGIPHADPAQVVVLNAGREQAGNAALIAAGTGLGEAILFWNGKAHVPSPSEGGHADFAPRDEDEIDLLRYILKKHGRVSWERCVSGHYGFRYLYDFLSESGRIRVPEAYVAKLATGDIGAALTAAAAGGEAFARTVMTWFARLYGAEAGNLALKALAIGGVYVSGGIAGNILPWLQGGAFMEAFVAKGRFRELLQNVPVRVLLDEDLPLKGAAVVAERAAR